jgi:hypothetical protein
MKNVIPAIALASLLAAPASAATGTEMLRCQKALENNTRAFTSYVAAMAGACSDNAVACKLADEIDAVDASACLASVAATCATVPAQVDDQQAQRGAKIVSACGLIPFIEVQQFVGGLGFFNVASACAAENVNELVACVLADARCSREKALFRADPRAEDSLTAAGVAAAFPCVAP